MNAVVVEAVVVVVVEEEVEDVVPVCSGCCAYC